MAPRDEDELTGPDDSDDAFDDPQPEIYLVDNGADMQIENLLQDAADPVDVDDPPWLPQTVDNDGSPGLHPYADANDSFEKQAGLEDDADDAGDEVLGDEFAAHIRHREASQYDQTGRPVSELAQMAQTQASQAQEHTDIAPYARINPPSAASAMLGGSVVAELFGPLVEVCRWTGDDQAEALPVTVTLSMVLPNFPNIGGGRRSADLNLRPYAVVQYGVRNQQMTIEVDIGTGCQFTVGASAVNVMVGIQGFDMSGNTDPTQEPQIQLIGQLSFYPVTRTPPVTRTVYFDSTDYGAPGDNKLVPLFGKKVTCYRCDNTVDGTVTLFDIVGFPMFTYDMPIGVSSIGPILLPGNVFKILIQNATGGATLNSNNVASAVFELAL